MYEILSIYSRESLNWRFFFIQKLEALRLKYYSLIFVPLNNHFLKCSSASCNHALKQVSKRYFDQIFKDKLSESFVSRRRSRLTCSVCQPWCAVSQQQRTSFPAVCAWHCLQYYIQVLSASIYAYLQSLEQIITGRDFNQPRLYERS